MRLCVAIFFVPNSGASIGFTGIKTEDNAVLGEGKADFVLDSVFGFVQGHPSYFVICLTFAICQTQPGA